MKQNERKESYDVVVVGGGISGVCAALAAARNGANTVIVQDRPVFGGNASSEIRMHICGAIGGGRHTEARETGIIEEILLDNRKVNPQDSFSVFDTVLWEKIKYQKNLKFYLNTHMVESVTENNQIKSILCHVMSSETKLEIEGKYFIDATGDGSLGAYSGARFMYGRESKDTFSEKYAPDVADDITMGSTIMFKAVDMGKPVTFKKPFWAYSLTEEELKYRSHDIIKSGYWWIEYGGDRLSTIYDNEEIRDELLKWAYGVWDHIKNGGDHEAQNYALDWVGVIPGKRESRRLEGDYIVKENDLLSGMVFDDAIAYGGWPMDMHVPGGIEKRHQEPTVYIHLDKLYSIPYRSIYSSNVVNLFLAGRASSNSRMAFGSTRVIATCGLIGQAAGTAAALGKKLQVLPREINSHIEMLKKNLAKDDCYIMGYRYLDENDLSLSATISSSSNQRMINNIKNGYTRNVDEVISYWESINDEKEWLCFTFEKIQKLKQMLIRFDSNLSSEIRISISYDATMNQVPGIPPELTKSYRVLFYCHQQLVKIIEVADNHQRFVTHEFEETEAEMIKIEFISTNGAGRFRLYDVNFF